VSAVRKRSSAFVLAAAALFGVGASGCSSSSASPSNASTSSTTSTSGAPDFSGDPSQWLSAQAGKWNAALNADQNSVNTAAAATNDASTSTYFSQLAGACTKMLDDAGKATSISAAPVATLQDAWKGMLSATETYADYCLQVAHSQSTSDLTAWKNSLKSMNSANRKWNAEVSKIQNAAAGSSG
jgi:hypothetical protein